MTTDVHEARKAAVYEAALQLIGQGVSPAALKIQQLALDIPGHAQRQPVFGARGQGQRRH